MLIIRDNKSKVLIASDEARVVLKFVEDKCLNLLTHTSKELLVKDTWDVYERHEYINALLEQRLSNNNKLLHWEDLKTTIMGKFLDRNLRIINNLTFKCDQLDITIESKTI